MNMMERLKLIVDMAAIRSRILGDEWKLVPSFGSHRIRTVDNKCPLKYVSREDSWTLAELEFNLGSADESTGGRETGYTVFLNAADGAEDAVTDIDSPAYQLRRHMLTVLQIGIALLLLLLPSLASAQTMITLANGGMVPCDHPLAIADGKGCNVQPAVQVLTPLPEPPPPTTIVPPIVPPTYQGEPQPFRLGHYYTRRGDGQVVYVAGLGQTSQGYQVWFMECRNTAFLDKCPTVGAIWTLFGNTVADGWVEGLR